MYGLLVAFEPTRLAPVTGGYNDSLNLGNMATTNEDEGTGNIDGGGSGNRRKRECWNCGGNQIKRNCTKLGDK